MTCDPLDKLLVLSTFKTPFLQCKLNVELVKLKVKIVPAGLLLGNEWNSIKNKTVNRIL